MTSSEKPIFSKEVELFWIRHGYSCANLLQDVSKASSAVRPIITKDAALSDIGVEQAKKLNRLMNSDAYKNKFDIILCSSMRRAMETALAVFQVGEYETNIKPRILVPVPFISEARNVVAKTFNIDLENVPMGSFHLEKYYESINGVKLYPGIKVDFNFLREYEQKKINLDPDDDKFIKQILPEIIGRYLDNKPNYKIPIVSHNHFITHHFKKYNISGIKNTEVWREKLRLDFNAVTNYLNLNVIPDFSCPQNFDELCSDNIKGKAHRVWKGVEPTKSNDLGRCVVHGKAYTTVGKAAINQSKKKHSQKSPGWFSFGKTEQSSNTDYKKKYAKYKAKYIELKNQGSIE